MKKFFFKSKVNDKYTNDLYVVKANKLSEAAKKMEDESGIQFDCMPCSIVKEQEKIKKEKYEDGGFRKVFKL